MKKKNRSENESTEKDMTKSKFLFNTSSIQSLIMCHEHGSISLARWLRYLCIIFEFSSLNV
jgi:hypothetical protein